MESQGKSNWRNMSICILIMIGMNGCATVSTVPVPVNSYCLVAKPISYDSKTDSSATVAAIEKHNSIWMCICEKDCPAKSGS